MLIRLFVQGERGGRFQPWIDVRTKGTRAALRYARRGITTVAIPHQLRHLWPDQKGVLPSLLTLTPNNWIPAGGFKRC